MGKGIAKLAECDIRKTRPVRWYHQARFKSMNQLLKNHHSMLDAPSPDPVPKGAYITKRFLKKITICPRNITTSTMLVHWTRIFNKH